MKLNPLKMFIQFTVIFVLYFVFAAYNLVWLYFTLIGVGFVVLLIYNILHIRGVEMYMDLTCNPIIYLQKIEKAHNKRTPEDEYQLTLAYAHIYRGKYEEAKQHFDQVDIGKITDQQRFVPIYLRIAAKFAYHDQNQLQLEALKNQATDFNDDLLAQYIQAHSYMLQERYDDVITLLTEYIPQQKSRLMLIELEYFLGICYVHKEQMEDALAVLEFVVNKRYPIETTDLAYEKHRELKE